MKHKSIKILAVILALLFSVESTIAYLTDSDADLNVMTLGRVEIELIEQERLNQTMSRSLSDNLIPFQDDHPIIPGVYPADNVVTGKETDFWPTSVSNAVDKIVTVKNTGNTAAYVRLWFAFEVTADPTFFDTKLHLNKNATDWKWEFLKDENSYTILSLDDSNYVVAVATYPQVLEKDATTPVSLRQVLMDCTATNEELAVLGEKYSIFVVAQGVQASGFDDAVTALNAGFKTPSVDTHPFAGMTAGDNAPVIPETPASDFTWENTAGNSSLVVTGYTGNATQISIPQNINGVPVTQIADNAFINQSTLTHIVLPEGITSIGAHAFDGCTSLISINLPSTVESIGAYAFANCDSLTSISFPAKLTTIPEGVCANCDQLTTVTMSADVTTMGTKAFYQCTNLECMTTY